MTITAALPTVLPNRQQEPEVFVPAMDAFFSSLPEIAEQIDIAIAALNFNSVTDTSSTSNAISIGANKTFTVSLGKSFYPGMFLVVADTAAPTTNSIIAQVFSYSGTTLVVTPLYIRGSGTKTNWVITHAGTPPLLNAGGSIFIGHTGNGNGSTNTRFRRITTVVTNTGQSIDWTYADSASLGGSWTFSTGGIYNIIYTDLASGAVNWGLSINSDQGTTDVATITETTKLVMTGGQAGADSCSVTTYLAVGAVLRAHNGGTLTNSDATTRIRIERLM